jgi:hypothetical protein
MPITDYINWKVELFFWNFAGWISVIIYGFLDLFKKK